MAFEIFISYRSADRLVANGLANRLKHSWGYDGRVWQDKERLQAGSSWSNGIETGLQRAELIVAVIGKGWLQRVNLDRLLEADDYVRRELAEALSSNKPVLPLVLDGLPIPKPSQLPPELRPMLEVECVRVASDVKSRDRRTLIGALSRAGQPPTGSVEPWIFDRAELAPLELLAAMRDHLSSWAKDGGCRIRVLLGAGGTGRTALLERLRADPPSGCLAALHVVRDSEAAPVPYRTAVHWFRDLIDGIEAVRDRQLRDRAGRALLDALRSSGTDLLAANGLVDRSRLAQVGRGIDDLAESHWGARNSEFPPRHLRHQIITAIGELSKVIPVMLLADDLHRLDDASADLVTDLQSAMRSDAAAEWQLALVVASRSQTAEDAPVACAGDLPDDPHVQAPFGTTTIDSAAEPTRALLDVVSRGGRVKLADDLRQWLCRQNYTPFLAVAALRRLNDDDRLADDTETGWQLVATTQPGSVQPERLDEPALLTYLLETEVTDTLVPTLEVGALLGLTFSFDLAVEVLGELHPGDGPERDELWRELRSNDLDCMVYRCFVDSTRAISFAHASFPASLVERMRPTRLAALREAIATVLRRRLDSDDRADWAKQLIDWASLATHLTAAKHFAAAAVAHMHAGELAARALAERQATRYYEQAHQLLDELLVAAERGPGAPELLLHMASCDVQKARLLRIGNGVGTLNLDQAERHLDEVEEHLHAAEPEHEEPAAAIRDLLTGAQAGLDRDETYRRIVHAHRGEVALERGRQHMHEGQLGTAEMELLSALRHAEDSPPIPARRRLIDSASADLAATLAMKLRDRRPSWREATTHTVARDALFHIARVVAFAPLPSRTGSERTPEAPAPSGSAAAQHRDAVVDALTTQGRLHHAVHRDVMLATRCYESAMGLANSSGQALEHGTLLSRAMLELAVADVTRDAGALERARTTLGDSRRHAAEIGSERHLLLAALGLAMAACVGDDTTPTALCLSRDEVDATVGLSAGERRRLYLFSGLRARVRNPDAARDADPERWFDGYPTVDDGLRAALWEFADELPRCVATWAAQLYGDDDDFGVQAWTTDFSASLAASQVDYLHSELDADQLVRRLALAFLDDAGREHARRVEALATELVDRHARPDEAIQLRRDVSIAAYLHDWFRALPMARVLSLARDWDLPVNGVEWANPQLLHGPLAAELFARQLRGDGLLGEVHFNRVRSMVKNHTVGCSDAEGPIAFVDAAFFLADCQAAHKQSTPGHDHPHWIDRALQPNGWRDALAAVREQKVRDLQAAGVTVHPRSLEPTAG